MPPSKAITAPSGEPSAAQRKMFAKMGIAMPDGSYYVRNSSDLGNAIQAVGRGVAAGDSGNAIRKHIMKRAAALKLTSKIPDTWNSDGSLKHEDDGELFEREDVNDLLEHFGVKGMRWGVRKRGSESDSPSAPPSADHAKAKASYEAAKEHGPGALTNEELQHLVGRLDLERQYSTLTATPASQSKVKKGRAFVDDQVKTGKTIVSAVKTAQEVGKVVGPLVVAGAAYGASRKAHGGSSSPGVIPRVAITS